MAVHMHTGIPCSICGFGLKNERTVLDFQKFVKVNEEHEEPIRAEIDPKDPDVKTLRHAGLMPREPLIERIDLLFNKFNSDEFQVKVKAFKAQLAELINEFIDDEDYEETEWEQLTGHLYDQKPDDLNILDWYIVNGD